MLSISTIFNVQAKDQAVEVDQHDLTRVLRSTLNQNPRALEKRSAYEAAGHLLLAEQWKRGPTLTLTYEDFDKRSPYGTVRVNQPLFAFWRIQNGINAAEQREIAAGWDYIDVQRTLMEEATSEYIQHQRLESRIEVLNETQTALADLDRMIQKRQQGGVASTADVTLVQARLATTRAQLQQSKGDLNVSVQRLANLTRLKNVQVNDPITDDFANILDDEVLNTTIMQYNPSLNRQEVELLAVNEESDQSMSSLFPTLYGRVEHDIDEPDDPVSTYDRTRYGLVLEYTLDGAGVTSYQRYKRSVSQVGASEAELDQSRLDLKTRVDNLLIERELQQALMDASERSVEALVQTKASYLRQYDAGRKSRLDVLNIVRELSAERLIYVDASSRHASADVQLAVLSGQLDKIALLERPASDYQE